MFKPGVLDNRFRYVVLFTGCACLTMISSNMLAFNIAQVCMGTQNETDEEGGEVKVNVSLKL
jgi:hypothetical protein